MNKFKFYRNLFLKIIIHSYRLNNINIIIVKLLIFQQHMKLFKSTVTQRSFYHHFISIFKVLKKKQYYTSNINTKTINFQSNIIIY